jgi:hypothetical protein
MSKIFNFGQPANQQAAAGAGGSVSGGDEETPFELELGGGPEKLQGGRAERRFMALNRHGCIDFFLPTEGSISEYVGASPFVPLLRRWSLNLALSLRHDNCKNKSYFPDFRKAKWMCY